MKVLVVMPLGEQRGGGELMLWHLMQQEGDAAKTRARWLVVFLEDGPLVASIRNLGIEVRVVPAGRLRQPTHFLRTAGRIAALARRERVDAIFGWMSKAHLYGGVAARLAGVPALWYQLGAPEARWSGGSWMDQLAARLPARGILTVSRAGADGQACLRPARPLRVVYPGAELERFEPDALPAPARARLQLGLPPDGPLIGIVGRLQRWKGMHVLIEAMPRVLAAHPKARAVIVGGEHAPEPDYPAYLERRARELGVEGHVLLTGLQRNVPEWMQAMDVIVHASTFEPFGIVVIEAMALGKPVVAGAAGGPTEIITPGVNGLLTPYGDTEALARALLRYLDEPEFAHRVGARARERAQEFSTARYAQNFVDALGDLLPEKVR